MTAIVALEYGDLQNTTITVSQNAASIGESSAMLQAGDSMNLESALKAMMICSGNDAATAIAECMGDSIRDTLKEKGDPNVPDGAYDAFVYAMNKKAKSLGMDDSLFANPHGLDFDQYSADMHCSARDVAKMCTEAMKNETFRNTVSTEATTIQVLRNGQQADVKLNVLPMRPLSIIGFMTTPSIILWYIATKPLHTPQTKALPQQFLLLPT